MSKKDVIAREFLHSTKLNTRSGTTIVISERLYHPDGTATPNLRTMHDPKRTYYIAKPQYRTNTIKRELIDISHTEQYTVPDSQMFVDAWSKLMFGTPKANMIVNPGVARRQVLASPYVYGVDVDIQVLIKHKYIREFDATGVNPLPPTNGFLDIERDVDTGVISIITYTHENVIHIAYLSQYGKGLRPHHVEKLFFETLDAPFDKYAETKADSPLLARYSAMPDSRLKTFFERQNEKHPDRKNLRIKFEPIIKEFDNEGELIQWIFGRVHHCKTSFVGVWNIDYDIPSITDRLLANGCDPSKVFCNPDLPDYIRRHNYELDKITADRDNAHISDYWHWLHCPGYTQFYDAMALYARLRKIEAKLPSYALDAVLVREGFLGKLDGGGHGPDWHRHMSHNEFPRYVMYGAVDCMDLQVMEWTNTDVETMLVLCGATHLAKYGRETRKSVDNLFVVMREKGFILGSCTGSLSNPWDKYLGAQGGAVLSPNRMNRSGLRPFVDCPQITTKIYACVNDIDLSAQYPTASIVLNICKETKIFTPVIMYGDHLKVTGQPAVEVFFTGAINRRTESVRLAKSHFNLPGFEEIEKICEADGW